MYKVLDVSIAGFWQKFTVKSAFREDVNVVIGKNGTGKTTFMNILHAVLAVDADALFENDFKSVTIRLIDAGRIRTIKAEKQESTNAPFLIAIYHISRKRYTFPLFSGDVPPGFRRRVLEEASKLREELSELVSLASLSVYRIGAELDLDARERPIKRMMVSPVDMRLTNLMQRLTHYQLELSYEARDVSSELQRNVLMSLLYKPVKGEKTGYALDFDENLERQNLISAYKQLGLSGSEIGKRIQEHINSIATTAKILKDSIKKPNGNIAISSLDFAPLEARKRTKHVVDLSLEAEKKTKEIFKQIDLFLDTLRGFIPDKQFAFEGGDLRIKNDSRAEPFPISKLSSGEKQLLILLIEALLQKQHPYIFLADEPELSLHIAWQRQIISAIRALNPNAQIIVATHSPEVAGRFKQSILDMEDILHV